MKREREIRKKRKLLPLYGLVIYIDIQNEFVDSGSTLAFQKILFDLGAEIAK